MNPKLSLLGILFRKGMKIEGDCYYTETSSHPSGLPFKELLFIDGNKYKAKFTIIGNRCYYWNINDES
jgi:hypothetical protein